MTADPEPSNDHHKPTLPAIWVGLHASQEAWERAAPEDRAAIDESDLSVLRSLGDISANRWRGLCEVAGWTPLGAAALSWCVGADLSQVRRHWESAAPVLEVDEAQCRPAQLLAPAVLAPPRDNRRRLSDIVLSGEDSNLQICLQIAHDPAAVLIDLPDDTLAAADTYLARHLLHAVETGAEPQERAEKLIEALTAAGG